MVDLWIMAHSAARREWLVKSVSNESEIRVAGTAATFAFLQSLMCETSADISLIELPETQSKVIRDWLLELFDQMPIVLLSPGPEPWLLNRIRQQGPGALLQSTASAEQIVLAIKSVSSGLTVVDGAPISQMSDNESMVEPLTTRESEVLRSLADGLTNKDIAARLHISEHTIKFHIRSILGKLGAASRTEAVARGLRSGLIEL
jgi:two-component system, NarL family, response regulator YdfI